MIAGGAEPLSCHVPPRRRSHQNIGFTRTGRGISRVRSYPNVIRVALVVESRQDYELIEVCVCVWCTQTGLVQIAKTVDI